MKTFDEYNELIAFTVASNNGHCDPLWAWLESAGELGEVLEQLMDQSMGAHGEIAVGGIAGDLATELATCYASLSKLEKLKKKLRRDQVKPFELLYDDQTQITPTPELLKELGGMLWGLNQLCRLCGTTLEKVADVNYRELKARFEGNPEWLLTKGAES